MNASAHVVDFETPIAPRSQREFTSMPGPSANEPLPALEESCPTRSPAMSDLHRQIERVATVDVPVLLLGESGVGKEFAARMLHNRSLRAQRTFLKINCAALPSELLESELFGYESGAFTGAVKSKPGLFELCDRGTILLDEIGEMPPSLQAKLLHVLQDQQFSRLGGRRIISVDVRIVAATNIDIEKALEHRTFRTDLYYRLNTITLRVPALRERSEDIPLFIDHFIDVLSVQLGCRPRPISQRLMRACQEHSWPGNVRELKSFICRHLVLQDDDALLSELFASASNASVPGEPVSVAGLKPRIASIRAEAEKQLIEDCLRKTHWNRTHAARLLHISTKTLWNKMRQYDIQDSSRRGDASNGDSKRELPIVDSGSERLSKGGGHPMDPDPVEDVDKVRPMDFSKRPAYPVGPGIR